MIADIIRYAGELAGILGPILSSEIEPAQTPPANIGAKLIDPVRHLKASLTAHADKLHLLLLTPEGRPRNLRAEALRDCATACEERHWA
jgi:hypothetical protein